MGMHIAFASGSQITIMRNKEIVCFVYICIYACYVNAWQKGKGRKWERICAEFFVRDIDVCVRMGAYDIQIWDWSFFAMDEWMLHILLCHVLEQKLSLTSTKRK